MYLRFSLPLPSLSSVGRRVYSVPHSTRLQPPKESFCEIKRVEPGSSASRAERNYSTAASSRVQGSASVAESNFSSNPPSFHLSHTNIHPIHLKASSGNSHCQKAQKWAYQPLPQAMPPISPPPNTPKRLPHLAKTWRRDSRAEMPHRMHHLPSSACASSSSTAL